MSSRKALPPVKELERLARSVSFPSSRADIERSAQSQGFSKEVIDFLDQFLAEEVFESYEDFMTRCEELEMLITEEVETPKEIPRTPLD